MGGLLEKKYGGEKGNEEQLAAIGVAVTAAIKPLQREIASLQREFRELKKAETPTVAVIDDNTRNEILDMMTSAAAGINSYKLPVNALFFIAILLVVSVFWNSHRLNVTAENMDWKYDVVTGILSGDRRYWWDGDNYEASRNAPESKRLQEALDHYQKITEQMKKQTVNK